jgi:hypothetical protein
VFVEPAGGEARIVRQLGDECDRLGEKHCDRERDLIRVLTRCVHS